MNVLRLETDVAELTLSTQGAAVLGWNLHTDTGRLPLLRPARHDGNGAPDEAAAFPLVPYGNRIGGNAFSFADRDYRLLPNAGDRHRLHGDGWLSEWEIEAAGTRSAALTLRHSADNAAPWDYLARQTIALEGADLTLTLSVRNTGTTTLPFGLGWHPYFPRTPRTRLTAPSSSVWLEDADHLPTEEVPLPADLDFRKVAGLPDRWINNGFEDWNGCARMDWPEHRLTMTIDADPIFSRYVVYQPEADRDPAYAGDWFCFEPMTHAVNGFALPGLGGLRPLAPGAALEGRITLRTLLRPSG